MKKAKTKAAQPFLFRRDVPEINEEDRRAEGLEEGGTLVLESMRLERVSLANREFHTVTMRDVQLEQCDLANLRTRALTMIRVELVNCRMTGWSGGEANCQDLLISGGDQRYSTFRFSRFVSTEFDACNLEEADFQETDLAGSVFRNCNLRNAEMRRVNLMNADLRGSVVEGLHTDPECLRGATVDAGQAMTFALLLGLRIL